jgi:hypothetical protein
MKNHFTSHPSTAGLRRATSGAVVWPRVLLLLLLGLLLLGLPARAQYTNWAKPFGASAQRSAVVTDAVTGRSYVLTTFTGFITVGSFNFTSVGGRDLLLVCYKSDGTVSWARQMGGPANEQMGDLALDAKYLNVVYVTGSFQSTMSLENAEGKPYTLTSKGGSDAFVAKYTQHSGTLNWARGIGGTGPDYGNGIDVSNAGHAYVTGSFTGSMTLNIPLGSLTLKSKGDSDVFLLRYESSGGLHFARALGEVGSDAGAAVGVHEATGDIYVTGSSAPASHPAISNVLVVKYDNLGIFKWKKLVGTAATHDRGQDLVVTDKGTYVTGYFAGSVTFGATTLTSAGSSDAFLVYYSHAGDGNAAWARQYGSTGWDEGHALAHHGGDTYLAGVFSGTVKFGSHVLNAKGGAGDQDLFVTRLAWDTTPLWAKGIGSVNFDRGDGGVAVNNLHIAYYTGGFGGPVTIKSTILNGPGNVIARVDPPEISDLTLVKASTDAFMWSLQNKPGINFMELGTKQINLEAIAVNKNAGSVKLILDGVEKIDNAAPFTWAGDTPVSGGTDYFGFTPTDGAHTLTVIPYSGDNATGVAGSGRTFKFTVVSKPFLDGLVLSMRIKTLIWHCLPMVKRSATRNWVPISSLCGQARVPLSWAA